MQCGITFLNLMLVCFVSAAYLLFQVQYSQLFLRNCNNQKVLLNSNYRKSMDLDLLLAQQSRNLMPQIRTLADFIFDLKTKILILLWR